MKLATVAAAFALVFAAGFVATGAAKVPGSGKKRHQVTTTGSTTTGSTTTTGATTTTGTTTTMGTTSTGSATTTTSAPTPPPPPAGTVLFRGDYDTGDFSQWTEPQSACTGGGYSTTNVGNTCASVVSSPVEEGSDAGKFTLNVDNPVQSSTDRAEVYTSVANTGGYEGQEWYYGWWTMFPAAGNPSGFWPNFANFNVFTQFHNPGSCAESIQLGINATGLSPYLYFQDDTYPAGNCNSSSSMIYRNLGSLLYDHWYHYVLRVKWSRDPSVGLVELWQDGTEVVPLTNTQTMANVPGYSVYWKQGFYRAVFGALNTVYQDGAVRADSFTAAQG
jgi:hypothetical protein